MRRVSKNIEQGLALKRTGNMYVEMPETMRYLLSAKVKLFGGAPITITSGTPVIKKGSVIDSIFSSVNFVRGKQNIKAGSGAMFRFFDLCVRKKAPLLKNSVGAALVLDPEIPVAGYASPSIGTTGQFFNIWEELTIYFENVFASGMGDRLKTSINTIENGATKKYALQLGCQDIESALLGVGNAAAITVTSLADLKIAVDVDEMEEDYPNEILTTYPVVANRETFYQIQDSAKIEPKQVNKVLRSVMTNSGSLYAVTTLAFDNAQGTGTTATGRQRNDNMITSISFNVDEKAPLGDFQTYKDCKNAFRNKWNYDAPIANGVSEETGFAGIVVAAPILIGTANRVCIKYSSAPQSAATDYGTSVNADLEFMAHYLGADVAKTA